MLAGVRHELGNYFHKLYYWVEVAGETERIPAGTGDSPVRMLDRTLHALEDFLRRTLACFEPLELATTTVAFSELSAAVQQRVAAALQRCLTVTEGAAPSAWVSVDLGRVSQVVDVVARAIAAHAAEVAPVSLETETCPGGVAIRIETATVGGASESIDALLDWATARYVVALHGGTLAQDVTGDRYRITLTLPTQQF